MGPHPFCETTGTDPEPVAVRRQRRSVNLDGHSGSMKSWRNMACFLFLSVFMATIELLKGDCYDYFNLTEWKENITDTIPLILTKDPKNRVECTVQRECLKGRDMCDLLYHCFDEKRDEDNLTITEKCRGDSYESVHYYHFMCLTAKVLGHTPEGCQHYETVCQHYAEKSPITYDTPTLPSQPPTAPTAPTTRPEPSVIRQSPTPPEITTAALPQNTTNTTTQVIPNVDGTLMDQISTDNVTETFIWKISCLISVILNIALLVNCLGPQWFWGRNKDKVRKPLNAEQTDVQLNTPVPRTNGNEAESTHLMESSERSFITINSPKATANDYLVENGTPHEGLDIQRRN